MAEQSILLWIIGAILTFTGLAELLLPLVPGAPLLFLRLLLDAWAEGFRYIGLWTLLLTRSFPCTRNQTTCGGSAWRPTELHGAVQNCPITPDKQRSNIPYSRQQQSKASRTQGNRRVLCHGQYRRPRTRT